MTLLTDAQRAALERAMARVPYGACSEDDHAVLSPLLDEMGHFALERRVATWLLAADARLRAQSARCPHITGSDEGTQWCRLGETTAAADAALARIGALMVRREFVDADIEAHRLAACGTIMARARALAEGDDNG